MNKIQLGKKTVTSNDTQPFVIAEVGVNHNCDMNLAKRLIDEAVEGGADSVKFQAYKAGTISMKKSPAYWDLNMEPTTSQYELFQKFDHFERKDYEELARHCEQAGTDFSCTPFDFESADFLADLMSFFKVSSSDLTNVPFLRHIAAKKKPIVLSTGAATLAEIDVAVRTIIETGNEDLALLHCVLNYPCPPENANLNTIEYLKKIYPGFCIGYSDHVPADESMLTLTYAALKGAVIIEKHFTHDKTIKGNDHFHSMTKDDLKVFRNNIEMYNKLNGSAEKSYLDREKMARKQARRSIVAAVNLKPGDKVSLENVTFKRPASGISPMFIDYVIGAEVTKEIAADDPIDFESLAKLQMPENPVY